ncbi:MAG TPA: hypothetical protein VEY71_02480 [Chitinophagales bacterium]|nr:hypothetical protein [Chitinophagales bacterium]
MLLTVALSQDLILFDRLQDAAQHWQTVSTNPYPFDFHRLRAIEETMADAVKPVYATAIQNGTVATFYFQFIPFRAQYFDSPFKKYGLTRKLESLVVGERLSFLMCGNLIAIDVPGYHFESVASDTSRLDVLQRVLHRVETQHRPSITTVKDVDDDLFAQLLDTGYADFGTDLTMALTINPRWKSFEDYTEALKHKYAQRVRKLQRAAAGIERRAIAAADFSQHRAAFQKLFLEVTKRQSIRILIPPMQYFEDLLTHDARFTIVGYFENHQPVLFATYFNHGDLTEVHYVGIDYAANERCSLYFNMMFDSVARAIENGSSTLELGRTARQAKAILGGEPVYFKTAIRFHNPVARWVFDTLRRRFAQKAGADWEPRHPFKKTEN